MSQTPSPLPPPQQGYSIELFFDPALENQVLKAWNVLARRQISTHLISISSRPHITLLSSSSSSTIIDYSKLQSALRAFATRHDPLPLSLSSVATSSNDSLFLVPTPTVSLLQLHSQMLEAVRKEGVAMGEVGEEYRPDSWVPHCDVAKDVPRNRMAEAFCIIRDMKLPVSGYVMDVGAVEFSEGAPVREVFSFPLGTSLSEA